MPKTKTNKRQAKSADTNDFAATTILSDDAIVVGALKLPDAAQYLSLSVPTVRRLIARGLLRPNRYTRHLLISIEECQRFLREGMTE
jgi:excisionase family DNA binding protein